MIFRLMSVCVESDPRHELTFGFIQEEITCAFPPPTHMIKISAHQYRRYETVEVFSSSDAVSVSAAAAAAAAAGIMMATMTMW
jgi:hypothetical protein